jgi:hypothetical protein
MPLRIFISYRRVDAAADAGRLADHLGQRLGRDQVFLDVDAIDPGRDFVQVLRESLRETAAVLVVIGTHWTTVTDAAGRRRLDDPGDFVRLEVEESLARGIPVVPVLVQGAMMPQPQELPASLASLSTRQAVFLDHAEFHDDANRLCRRLEKMLGIGEPTWQSMLRRWWPAAAIGLAALALGGYFVARQPGETGTAPEPVAAADTEATQALLVTAESQRSRNQYGDALATLERARAAAPASDTVQQAREAVAMEWIRNARYEGDNGSFGAVIKPALAVVDAALASASGSRRADLLAHQGWATFLIWRDGDRRLDPAVRYQEALAIDPSNPFANAMLAHWKLFEDGDDVATAVRLFAAASVSGRAPEAVRELQWAAYANARNSAADAERVRLADAMRRDGQRLDMRQAQALWAPYYFATTAGDAQRNALLDALAPDAHISTLHWAFDEYAAQEPSRLWTLRYYTALLDAKAGRAQQAVAGLETLRAEMAREGADGSLSRAVQASLKQLRP